MIFLFILELCMKRLDYDMMTIGRIRPLEIRMYIVVRMDDFTPSASPFDIFVYDLIIRPLHKQDVYFPCSSECTFEYNSYCMNHILEPSREGEKPVRW